MTSAQHRAPDAVVIGGGIIGICAALHLQRSGRQVTVLDPARPGDAASGHNGGVFSVNECVPTAVPGIVGSVPRMLRDPLAPLAIRWRYMPRLTPWLVRFVNAGRAGRVELIAAALQSLTRLSLEAYRPLISGTEAEAMVREGGMLFAYRDEPAFAAARFGNELRARLGVSYDILDDAGITELDPFLAGRFHCATYHPDPRFTWDPQAFTLALADELTARGGRVEPVEVDGFETAGSQVVAVRTKDRSIPTTTVVIAAGAWSRRLVRRLGFDVPLDTERGYGVHLPSPNVSLGFPILCRPHQFALTPAGTGLRLSGTDELAGLSAPPNYARADKLVEAARIFFPELRTDGATRWMSHRPSLPDSLPIIDRAPRHSNVVLAFGHGHKGLTLGAITGKLVQELVDDKPPTVDLHPFSARRFSLWKQRRAPQERARET